MYRLRQIFGPIYNFFNEILKFFLKFSSMYRRRLVLIRIYHMQERLAVIYGRIDRHYHLKNPVQKSWSDLRILRWIVIVLNLMCSAYMAIALLRVC